MSGALLMVEQTLLPHFLPHHALAAVERFGIVVSDVQPPAMGGAREPDNQRADAEVLVRGVQENDVSIPDGAALARVVALSVAQAQLSADVLQRHLREAASWRCARRWPLATDRAVGSNSR